MNFTQGYSLIKLWHETTVRVRAEGKNFPSLMLWGRHGMGKSTLPHTVCKEEGWGLINLRLSQMESSDIRGLPAERDGETAYLPPSDLPIGDMSPHQVQEAVKDAVDAQRHLKNGILFLDELFRADDAVLQAVFQLVLDYRIGRWVLPAGWAIVSANNFFEGYCTNSFTDPALLDRFAHIILSPTLDEWVDFMASCHGDAAAKIIEFVAATDENLYGPTKPVELGFRISPSPRSWDAVAEITKTEAEESVRDEAIAGLIGFDLLAAYRRYDCPIKPKMLLEDGVKKHAKVLKKLNRSQLLSVTYGLRGLLIPLIEEEHPQEVALDYAEHIIRETEEGDLATGFLCGLVNKSSATTAVHRAALTNTKIAALLAKAERKQGLKGSLIQAIQKRPELAKLISHTTWGLDVEGE